jgi:flagellum-specific peptidoglycan hydrolase FlgJ
MIWKKLLICICICFIYFKAENENSLCYTKHTEYKINSIKNSEFSLESLKKLLYLYNISDNITEIMIKQSILETGYYSSPIFIENNNLFGMKHPRVRKTTSIGINKGHAVYQHWTDSVDDYLLWMKYYENRGILCIDDYEQFLERIGYAEDPLYLYKLANIDIV